MQKKALKKNDSRIWFAQLLGMSDHISFNLSKEEYNVAKYVPDGQVTVADLLSLLSVFGELCE